MFQKQDSNWHVSCSCAAGLKPKTLQSYMATVDKKHTQTPDEFITKYTGELHIFDLWSVFTFHVSVLE